MIPLAICKDCGLVTTNTELVREHRAEGHNIQFEYN